jgi:putative ABC transport system permease protein
MSLSNGTRLLTNIWADAFYAVRSLRRSAGFTAVTTLTLALGLGSTTALFTIADATLFRSLPYRDANRLVLLGETSRNGGVGFGASLPDVNEWRTRTHVVSPISLYSSDNATDFVEFNGKAEQMERIFVSANIFATLGVTPLSGRPFISSDGSAGAPSVVILSYAAWKEVGEAETQLFGDAIRINGSPFTVIGIMPPGFAFPAGENSVQVWTPIVPLERDQVLNYQTRVFRVIARLDPGVTPITARTQLSAVQTQLAKGYSDPWLRGERSTVSVRDYRDSLMANRRPVLTVLSFAVAALWLIACVNAANLMLVRGASRAQELAMRVALGAARGRILQQLLTESLLLSGIGAVVGAALSAGALTLFGHAVQRQFGVQPPLINGSILLSLAGLAVLTTCCFGLLPAVRASSISQSQIIRTPGMGICIGRSRIRGVLIVVQLGLSLTLLVCCGLLLQTLYVLHHVVLGFRADHVVVASVNIPGYRYVGQNLATELYQPLLQRVYALPGMEAACVMSSLPLGPNPLQIEMYTANDSTQDVNRPVTAFVRVVSLDCQRVMQFRILRGRFFNSEDTPTSQRVVLVNRAFEQQYWHSDQTMGRALLNFGNGDPARVIGIIADFRQDTIQTTSRPEIELCLSQLAPGTPLYKLTEAMTMNLVVRALQPFRSVAPELRQLLRQTGPEFGGAEIETMDHVVADSVGSETLVAHLLEVFAATALVLAMAGLYSLLTYMVSRGTKEFGIRLALGAQRRDIFKLVIHRACVQLGGGVLLGYFLFRASTAALRVYLYGVAPDDLVTFAAVSLLLVGVGIAAAYVPARRASTIDPAVALRQE